MNGNDMLRAANAEIRHLKFQLNQMQSQLEQTRFLEQLTCAALTGLVSQGKTPDECKGLAVQYAEGVLNQIMIDGRKAVEEEQAAKRAAELKENSQIVKDAAEAVAAE